MFGPIFVELKCSDEKTKVFKNSSTIFNATTLNAMCRFQRVNMQWELNNILKHMKLVKLIFILYQEAET
jgi:hypothetical protein